TSSPRRSTTTPSSSWTAPSGTGRRSPAASPSAARRSSATGAPREPATSPSWRRRSAGGSGDPSRLLRQEPLVLLRRHRHPGRRRHGRLRQHLQDREEVMGMIIGLTGQARAGKDTIAEFLAQKYGFVRIGLADPMKRFCQHLFDWNDEQVWGNKKEEGDPRYKRWERNEDGIILGSHQLSPRFALQTLGTEWGRLCCEDIWTIYGLRVAKELLAGYSRYTPK